MQNGSTEGLAIIPVDPYLSDGPPSITQWTGSTTGIARQLRELADSLDKKEVATMLLLKKYDDAADLFYKAINRNPQSAEFHNNLAELFISLKNYDRAIEEYNKVLKLEPDNLVALFNLGVIFSEKGDYLNAGKQWQSVLDKKPGDTDARKALLSLKGKKNKDTNLKTE